MEDEEEEEEVGEEGGGTMGRGEGVGAEEESGDDLEFHDAHSELPGTDNNFIQVTTSGEYKLNCIMYT